MLRNNTHALTYIGAHRGIHVPSHLRRSASGGSRAWAGVIRTWFQRSGQHRALSEPDDRLLRDIGATMKRIHVRRRTASAFILIVIGSTWSPMACAEPDGHTQITFPVYEAERFCSQAEALAPQSASDCLATELAFKWALSRVWPHVRGQEKDQAKICMNTVNFTLPETGSFRALAECVSGLRNVNE
jgi:uncharacterized protein YjiS (DUF1127 family)